MAKEVILEIQEITKRFGGLVAVNKVSTEVCKGEIVALIGPNGSGKTTLLNVISGLYSPEDGKILFKGKEIQAIPPYHITQAGLTRTFQNIRLFDNLSILKNIMIGTHIKGNSNLFDAIINNKSTRVEELQSREKAMECLDFVGLNVDPLIKAGSISYGQRRLVEVARAIASDPSLLLLDETAAGLNPQEKQHMTDIIRKIRDRGISVLFVEHDMSMVMSAADRITVLNFGSRIAEGTPKEIQCDPLVLAAYLGKDNYVEAE